MKDVGLQDLPESPKRSVQELVDCLRLMPKSLAADRLRFPPAAGAAGSDAESNDLYDASPPFSPIEDDDEDEVVEEIHEIEEIPMSEEEANRILWPDAISAQVSSPIGNGKVRGDARD